MTRLDLARGQATALPKALIFGPEASAVPIAERMELEGFGVVIYEQEARAQGWSLPPPWHPQAADRLREVLDSFVRVFGGRGSAIAQHCIHPGVSDWAERSELLAIAQEFGLNVIAPSSRVLSLFSNQLSLLNEADSLGIPNLVLSFDPIQSVREVERTLHQHKHGFPVVLKSVRGVGGFAICVLQQPEDLTRKLPMWLEQLRSVFGEAMIFAERYMEGARQISLPFVRFPSGKIEFFPLVDVSLQCRYRPWVEFSPPPGLDQNIIPLMVEYAEKLLNHCNYVGVGSLEFLVDGHRLFLVDGVARLNADFVLWEKISATSMVSWQLAALGLCPAPKYPTSESTSNKTGLALKLYAEDPLLQLPQPGVVQELSEKREWRLPGAQAEVWLSIRQGEEVDPDRDGMIGQIFVTAQDRMQALAVARSVLEELWIAGSLQTNERFLMELLSHPWVREGIFHTSFVDEEFIPEIRPTSDGLKRFAAVCAFALGDSASRVERWVVGDQWVKMGTKTTAKPGAKSGIKSLKWVQPPDIFSADKVINLHQQSTRGVSGTLEDPEFGRLRVCAYPIGDHKWTVRIGSWVMQVKGLVEPSRAQIPGQLPMVRKLYAMVSGRVHAILFQPGSLVPAHEPILMLESLRILVAHASPVEVRVAQWKVKAEEHVRAGQELGELIITSHSSSPHSEEGNS